VTRFDAAVPAEADLSRRSIAAHPPLALDVQGLACRRGGRLVFEGVGFRLESGCMLAVSGPNGAGKSSLLRILAGLLRPEAGTLRLEGADDEPAVHYLGHADALKPALTLAETLYFWAAAYRSGAAPGDGDIAAAAEAAGIGHALDFPVGVLSAGQRRRAGLARLLVSPRPLWLLDEPTAALDAEGEALLGRLIAAHLGGGGLVVAATHQPLPVRPDSVLELWAA
jgi:heme exporter protein A